MKAINVSELKANLSKYLRMASRGTRIVVKDRDEPIAELGPLPKGAESWRTRLAQAGRLRPGTQDWGSLRVSRCRSGSISRRLSRRCGRIRVRYVDASAVLRVLFREPGLVVPLSAGDRIVSSLIVEVETFRAVDRERLLGRLDDAQTATKRRELTDLLAMLDLAAIDGTVVARAKRAFPVNVRALDAIHVATAEILEAEAIDEPLEFWTHDGVKPVPPCRDGLTVRGTRGLENGGVRRRHVRSPRVDSCRPG
jgi:antitoxin (DNA-binding transcriptional repressor) of toxin-antitoxin stability system/predicted nucleic acid-binding protein